jgi:hypothetical protein
MTKLEKEFDLWLLNKRLNDNRRVQSILKAWYPIEQFFKEPK